MKGTHVFPLALICLDVAAGLMFLGAADWRKTVYWFAAATLTAVVTF